MIRRVFEQLRGNDSGMTLVEVMITSAIMMVLALAMASFMTSQHQNMKAIREKSTFTSVGNAVRTNAAADQSILNSAALLDP